MRAAAFPKVPWRQCEWWLGLGARRFRFYSGMRRLNGALELTPLPTADPL
jgi:hypothetical protein